MATTIGHVRVDGIVREAAARTLAAMGMSVSDAVRMLLIGAAETADALLMDLKIRAQETPFAARSSGAM